MPSGGARNRSGPPPNPNSGRSDRRGLSFTALPAAGWDGDVPRWPLPSRRVYIMVEKVPVYDADLTQMVADRERELWEWAWRTPQACAWAQPSESWRLHTVAMWVRTFVICEGSDATAADKGSLHRFADQIGLTPAGLRENGWSIAKDEVAERAATREKPAAARPKSSRDRMKVVSAG